MGRSKPLLPWGDRTLLEAWFLRLRSVGVGPIAAVLGSEAEMIQAEVGEIDGVSFITNPEPDATGPRESLMLGLNALPEGLPAWFVPVDVPVVCEDALRRVHTAYEQARAHAEGGRPPLAALPTHRGNKGHPVLVGPDFLDRLAEGERGDRIDSLFAWATRRLVTVDVDDIRVVGNMNRPVDYQAFAPPPGSNWDWEEPREPASATAGIDALETLTHGAVSGPNTDSES